MYLIFVYPVFALSSPYRSRNFFPRENAKRRTLPLKLMEKFFVFHFLRFRSREKCYVINTLNRILQCFSLNENLISFSTFCHTRPFCVAFVFRFIAIGFVLMYLLLHYDVFRSKVRFPRPLHSPADFREVRLLM